MHASICDYIADLAQNSIEAGASHIELEVYTGPEVIRVCVSDNGCGMDNNTLEKAVDPFYSKAGKHDHRRIGMGLPLLYQTAEAVNGTVEIQSAPGKGTKVRFAFDATHLDTPPLGDLSGTIIGMMTFPKSFDLRLIRKTPRDSYGTSRSELSEVLGCLDESANTILAKNFIQTQEDNLIL
ncbi:MAG: ATP-binding protein [Kiritimatiellia bacterium]